MADLLLDWMKKEENVWFKDFSLEYGISWRYLLELSKKSKPLTTAIEIAKQMQESKLFKAAINSKSQAIYIFALKNVAGWRDITEENSENPDGADKFAQTLIRAAKAAKEGGKNATKPRN